MIWLLLIVLIPVSLVIGLALAGELHLHETYLDTRATAWIKRKLRRDDR